MPDAQQNTELRMVIGEIEKSPKTRLTVSVREYKGHQFIDIREYYRHKDTAIPTKKGVTVKADTISQFLKIMEMAEYSLINKLKTKNGTNTPASNREKP